MLAELATGQPRRWLSALGTALATILLVAIPTGLIDTPLFIRGVPPTRWAWPYPPTGVDSQVKARSTDGSRGEHARVGVLHAAL